jgi:hypothetical protein
MLVSMITSAEITLRYPLSPFHRKRTLCGSRTPCIRRWWACLSCLSTRLAHPRTKNPARLLPLWPPPLSPYIRTSRSVSASMYTIIHYGARLRSVSASTIPWCLLTLLIGQHVMQVCNYYATCHHVPATLELGPFANALCANSLVSGHSSFITALSLAVSHT